VTVPPLLVARAGGERYGLDIAAVREVVPVGEVTPVPSHSLAVRGVMPLRERYLSLFSLEALLTGRMPLRGQAGAAVVVALGGAEVALEVDEVEAVVDGGGAFLSGEGVAGIAARGVCRCGESLVTVLDSAQLAERVAAFVERVP
jgi:chemotaxis signal transduction protein